jgi:hypothetical protein
MAPSRSFASAVASQGFVILPLALLAGTATCARADLHFAAPAFDAGEARSGQPLRHVFGFVNDGPETVAVTGLHPGCGCLVPKLEKRIYAPGERGALLLEINTLAQPEGPHTWSVQAQYRCGEQPREVTLQMRATVVHEISVQPAALIVFADRAVSHDITLTDTRTMPLSITGLHATSRHLTSRVTENGRNSQGRQQFKIHLALGDLFPEGRHEEALHIITNDPAYADLTVTVTVIKRPRQRVQAFPGELTWARAGTSALPSQIVRLRDGDDAPVVVDHIVPDHPALSCRWAPGPGAMATLRITVASHQLSAGNLQSAVHVHVSKPFQEILTIPVTVRD